MAPKFDALLKDFSGTGCCSAEELAAVEHELGHHLDRDYRSFMLTRGGGEGSIGDGYLILWKMVELLPFNREYEVEKRAPGLLLFGSSGGGEGYGFDRRSGRVSLVRVPFIGLSWRHAIEAVSSFGEFLGALGARRGKSRNSSASPGLEVFEIKPVVFGGSATDAGNKTLLTREQHFGAVRFWNNLLGRGTRG